MTDPPFEEGAIINSDIEKVVGLNGCGGSIWEGTVSEEICIGDASAIAGSAGKADANNPSVTAMTRLRILIRKSRTFIALRSWTTATRSSWVNRNWQAMNLSVDDLVAKQTRGNFFWTQ